MDRVRNGRIELDEEVHLPDGAEVRVEIEENESRATTSADEFESLGSKLLRHAGTAEGLPADAARHYDRATDEQRSKLPQVTLRPARKRQE